MSIPSQTFTNVSQNTTSFGGTTYVITTTKTNSIPATTVTVGSDGSLKMVYTVTSTTSSVSSPSGAGSSTSTSYYTYDLSAARP